MSKELGMMVNAYCERWGVVNALIAQIDDVRKTAISRIMSDALDPKKIRLIDQTPETLINANVALTDIMAAVLCLTKHDNMTTGEALTVGVVLEHLLTACEFAGEHGMEMQAVVGVFFPQLDRRVTEAFVVAGHVDRRYMALFEKEGIRIEHDSALKQFNITTPKGPVVLEEVENAT